VIVAEVLLAVDVAFPPAARVLDSIDTVVDVAFPPDVRVLDSIDVGVADVVVPAAKDVVFPPPVIAAMELVPVAAAVVSVEPTKIKDISSIPSSINVAVASAAPDVVVKVVVPCVALWDVLV
jgi:hypothetical protein